MSTPYVIRLRHPWQCEPAADGLRYARAFNCPTNLGKLDRVWLAIEGRWGDARVMLGALAVGKLDNRQSPQRFDITRLLKPHNVLSIEVAGPSVAPPAAADEVPLPGEVRLEIVSLS